MSLVIYLEAPLLYNLELTDEVLRFIEIFRSNLYSELLSVKFCYIFIGG